MKKKEKRRENGSQYMHCKTQTTFVLSQIPNIHIKQTIFKRSKHSTYVKKPWIHIYMVKKKRILFYNIFSLEI